MSRSPYAVRRCPRCQSIPPTHSATLRANDVSDSRNATTSAGPNPASATRRNAWYPAAARSTAFHWLSSTTRRSSSVPRTSRWYLMSSSRVVWSARSISRPSS